MASQAPSNPLPLLYNDLQPVNLQQHGDKKLVQIQSAPHIAQAHAIPVTVDEFALLQRTYPIVFSVGDNSVPLALMGLNEGVNTFLDDKGMLTEPVYLPAYLRRYPFLLAQLTPDSDELSLCVDSTSGVIGEASAEGDAIFDGDQPGEKVKAILDFCEQFEAAGQRTAAFMAELEKSGLLMDGEVAIQPDNSDQPFIYRGFRMIDEEKLRDMRGDELRKMNQSGMLPLIFAHLFSLAQIRDIFGRQVAQGKGPVAGELPVDAMADA